MAGNRKAAIGFIFITLLIDVMGWGLIIPVMPKLISQLKGIPVNEASPHGAWLIAAYAITQFVFAPVVGNLSDQYGRRPVLLPLHPIMAGYSLVVWWPVSPVPVLQRHPPISPISAPPIRGRKILE